MTKNLELFVHSRRTQAAKQLDDPSLQTFTRAPTTNTDPARTVRPTTKQPGSRTKPVKPQYDPQKPFAQPPSILTAKQCLYTPQARQAQDPDTTHRRATRQPCCAAQFKTLPQHAEGVQTCDPNTPICNANTRHNLAITEQSPSTSQSLLKHSNCLHSAANQLDNTIRIVPGRQAAWRPNLSSQPEPKYLAVTFKTQQLLAQCRQPTWQHHSNCTRPPSSLTTEFEPRIQSPSTKQSQTTATADTVPPTI